MKSNFFPWPVLLLILMTGCLARPMYVPYDANMARGYRDHVDTVHNIYTVEYWGGQISQSSANAAAMYRVADLTLQHGGDYFTVTHDSTDTFVRLQNGGVAMAASPEAMAEEARADREAKQSGVKFAQSGWHPLVVKTFSIGNGSLPAGSLNAKDVLAQYKDEIKMP